VWLRAVRRAARFVAARPREERKEAGVATAAQRGELVVECCPSEKKKKSSKKWSKAQYSVRKNISPNNYRKREQISQRTL
jgi:hypothetical protein